VALRQEVGAEEQAGREEQRAARAALAEARGQFHGAVVDLSFAREEVDRWARLQERGYIATLDYLHAKEKAQQRQTTADALRLEVSRREKEMQTKEQDRAVRLEQLHSEVKRLEGQSAATAQAIERLAHEVDKRHIRAPVAGRLGEVANLRTGAFVPEGDRLGAVVPPGELRAIAYFPPPSALGRLRPGQPAWMRLNGFPWTQYGSITATVANVASEVRDGQVRVELSVHPDPASLIPLQHGLPGTVEVEVDHVSPALLLIRVAGTLIARPLARSDSAPPRRETQ
jgi:membrane fusion protein (multidrug efflux system)